MANETSLISKILSAGEQKMTDLTNELLGNPKFASALGKTIQKGMETKGRLDKNIQIVLSSINMPTKADYDRLTKKVNALNKSINDIDLRIEALIKKIDRPAAKKPAAKKAVAKKAPAKKATKKAKK